MRSSSTHGLCLWLCLLLLSSGCAQQKHAHVLQQQAAKLRGPEQQVEALAQRVRRLEARHNDQARLHEQDPQVLRARIARLQEKRAELLQELMPAHPDVVALDRRIATLERQLARLQAGGKNP